MRAQFVFSEVWIGLRRNLTMTIALVVVVAISLSLLGTGLLFVQQVNQTRTFWQGKVQLSVYLCTKFSASPQCTKNGPATSAEIGVDSPDAGRAAAGRRAWSTCPRRRRTSSSSRSSRRW